MNKKQFWLPLSIVALLLIISGSWFLSQRHEQNVQAVTIKSTPTLFLHGWGSSVRAEHQMTAAAQEAGVTDSVTQAIVDPKGKVKLIGQIPSQAHNPIIEVGFQDNRNSNYHQDGRWLKNVIVRLQQKYHIKNINLVGHSMGNMAIVYYLLDNGQNKTLPKLRKQVDIAGHFNGIIGQDDSPNKRRLMASGRPDHWDRNYQELLALRHKYPKHQVRVLNIFGDKNDGTHADGDVTNASSQSLRYLIASRALSYQEYKIVGASGQHSRLHENKQVDQILIHFLWQ